MSRSTAPTTPRVAVVTGGTAGVGRAVVRELAGAGYDVAVLARGEAGLAATARDVEGLGRRCLPLQVDVADGEAVEAATDRVEAELGEIDVWVNNAFVGALSYFWDTTPEEQRRLTDVTYHGQVHGLRAALRVMRPRDRGSVVNVSSAMAYRSIPLQAAYCGAKHAVKGLTESVHTELLATGSAVRVSLVTLPGLNTPQFTWNLNRMAGRPMPVPPILEPEVAARAIRHVAEHPRRNAWVGIAAVYTVLGNRLAPAFMDRYLARTGVDSQQTEQATPRLGSNVFEPRDAERDQGARGPFSDQSGQRDPVSAIGRHRRALTGVVGAGVLAGLTGGALRAARR